MSSTQRQGSSVFGSLAISNRNSLQNKHQMMSARFQSGKDMAAKIKLRGKLIGTNQMI